MVGGFGLNADNLISVETDDTGDLLKSDGNVLYIVDDKDNERLKMMWL